MAEEIPRGPESPPDADQQDDVLGKIDQLLSRHRPKPPAVEAIPVLTDAPPEEEVSLDDAIPVLTDVVTGPGRPVRTLPEPSRFSSIDSALILQRMQIALDAEHIRLLAQINRNDAEKARMVDRLVTGLKQALPGIVRAAIKANPPDPGQPGDDGRL